MEYVHGCPFPAHWGSLANYVFDRFVDGDIYFRHQADGNERAFRLRIDMKDGAETITVRERLDGASMLLTSGRCPEVLA